MVTLAPFPRPNHGARRLWALLASLLASLSQQCPAQAWHCLVPSAALPHKGRWRRAPKGKKRATSRRREGPHTPRRRAKLAIARVHQWRARWRVGSMGRGGPSVRGGARRVAVVLRLRAHEALHLTRMLSRTADE